MPSAYRRGYNFECRVRKAFRDKGWFVSRQGKSVFPDLICIKARFRSTVELLGCPALVFVECRSDGYLDPSERSEFLDLVKKTDSRGLIAYKDGRSMCFKELGWNGKYLPVIGISGLESLRE